MREQMEDIGNSFEIKDQQLKAILFIYRLLFQNLMVTANNLWCINKETKNDKESKHNTKVSHQIIRPQMRKKRKKTYRNQSKTTKWQ